MRDFYQITCIVNDTALEEDGFYAEHGLSFLIETPHGEVLFDTGKTEEVLSHNMELLNIDPQNITTLALSHSHYDHTGGLEWLLRQGKHPKILANPDFFTQHYAYRNEEYHFLGMNIPQDQVIALSDLQLSAKPIEIIPGLWTSGIIENREEPQGRNKDHVIRQRDAWIQDPYLDDLSLVLETPSGLVLICGCCHAGILNTLLHVERVFNQKIIKVFGGIHLMSADEATTQYVIDSLDKNFPCITYYLNHCTGEKTVTIMKQVFKGRVFSFPAGKSVGIV